MTSKADSRDLETSNEVNQVFEKNHVFSQKAILLERTSRDACKRRDERMSQRATMDEVSPSNWAAIQSHLQFHLNKRAHSLQEGSSHEALFHCNCFIEAEAEEKGEDASQRSQLPVNAFTSSSRSRGEDTTALTLMLLRRKLCLIVCHNQWKRITFRAVVSLALCGLLAWQRFVKL